MNSLVTDIDKAVPFLKIFVFPYLTWYPFIFGCLIYFFIKDRRTYSRTLISLIIGILVSYTIYFVFQTTVPRPELSGTDLATRLVGFVYSMDMPYNCFPSLHVYESYIMIKAIRVSSIRNKMNTAIIYIISALIILSTQFIKQHVILDLISSVILGDILFSIVNSFSLRGIILWVRKHYSSLMMKRRLEN
jgi:membrane-associated phospholipid phosphatase